MTPSAQNGKRSTIFPTKTPANIFFMRKELTVFVFFYARVRVSRNVVTLSHGELRSGNWWMTSIKILPGASRLKTSADSFKCKIKNKNTALVQPQRLVEREWTQC